MLLEKKVAVIYGAGGAIGGAVAEAFAREGASVFLAGRTRAPLDRVAARIGTGAEAAEVDALDEAAVDAYVDGVVQRAGRVDISFNVIGTGDVQRPLTDLSPEEFLQPIVNAARTQFLTTRAAVRHMAGQGSGVILMFGGSGPQTLPGLGGFKVSLDAMESQRRQWACELAAHGIRIVTLKTGGVPESIPADFPDRDEIIAGLITASPTGRVATLADVGDIAAFVASDRARTITNSEVNISCGAIVD